MAKTLTKEQPISKTIKTSKNFSYAKNECSLTFNLNVDNSRELRDFLTLLKVAQQDIIEILDPMKN